MKDVPYDDISELVSHYESAASTHCEPVYLMRGHANEKHDANTESATLTYVKFEQKMYALTCAHVADARGGEGSTNLIPTVWGTTGKGFAFRSGSKNVLAGEFKAIVDAQNGRQRLDIAIAPLSEEFVHLHMADKGKAPIDMDDWEELDWSVVRTCATWGYPNGQKSSSDTTVSASLLTAILDVQSQQMSFERDEFLLASTLPGAEGISLSGLSGSAVYCLHKDGKMTAVGIIYEGSPGDPSSKKSDGSFYGPSDFHIKAVVLSRKKFRSWLESSGLIMRPQASDIEATVDL